ncbi:Mur ligase family protein, partial [bacterium]|nr:Mur ligase family protein [bacterium]
MTTYKQAMEFLLNRTNYEQKQSTSYRHTDFKLDRMKQLLEELGNPQCIPSIHIAGTKGKGSTAHMVAACLHSAGHRVGLFTSPHLERYEQRIQIDGEMISESQLIEQTGTLKTAVETLRSKSDAHEPTFFELTTALAWLCFRDAKVEIAVMEVGLGGRLDSTNICHPIVTVITSIGIDHTEQLGNTITEIAREKAGIIKLGIPVISGCKLAEAQKVIRDKSQQLNCPLTEVDLDITYSSSESPQGDQVRHHIRIGERSISDLTLPLLGEHQIRNLATALGAIDAM